MSGIDKDDWDEKAGKIDEERVWTMTVAWIEGEDAVNADTSNSSVGVNGGNEATNAEMSDAPLHENDSEVVAGGVVDTGSAPPTENNAANEPPNTQTARGNAQTLRVRCLLCERVVPRGSFQQHALSRRHRWRQKKLRAKQSASAAEAESPPETEPYPDSEPPAVNNKPVAVNKPVRCGYCDRSYANRETFKAHCKTDKHQERKAHQDREEGRLGPDPEPLPNKNARYTPQEDETILHMYWDMKSDVEIAKVIPHGGYWGVSHRISVLLNGPEHKELRARVDREREEKKAREEK